MRVWYHYGWAALCLPGLLACPAPTSLHTHQKSTRQLSRQLTRFNQKQHAHLASELQPQESTTGTNTTKRRHTPPALRTKPPAVPWQNTLTASISQQDTGIDAPNLEEDSASRLSSLHLLPPMPLPPPLPVASKEIPGLPKIAKMFRRLGEQIMRSGRSMRWRQLRLIRRCRNASASRAGCRTFKRAARMFAINYQTSPRNYRGYLLFHSKRKRKIPASLMRWYKRLANQRYRHQPAASRCYLSQGLPSNCMSFAMCTQKSTIRRFRGSWGKGFHVPLWGYVNYWSTEAYDALQQDYTKDGVRRPGVQTLLRTFEQLSYPQKQRLSRQLLTDIYQAYLRKVKRSRRVSRYAIPLFQKAFCTNIVVSDGDFSRALPGDLFVLSFPRKRSRKQRIPSEYRHQHWGLIDNPTTGKIMHMQTPGGVWGRSFHRWGIQYDTYEPAFRKRRQRWKWNRHRKRYEQRAVFVNRLNLHYLLFARKQNTKIYNTKHQQLCQSWINQHAALYFANLASASLIREKP